MLRILGGLISDEFDFEGTEKTAEFSDFFIAGLGRSNVGECFFLMGRFAGSDWRARGLSPSRRRAGGDSAARFHPYDMVERLFYDQQRINDA